MVACVLLPLGSFITQRKFPPRLDARPPASVPVPMPAPTTLSELIAHSSTPDPILDTHTPSANSTLTATARA